MWLVATNIVANVAQVSTRSLTSLFFACKKCWLASLAYALVKKASLKPEEALIYIYDGPMVGMSELVQYSLWQVFVLPMVLPTDACKDNATIRSS